MIIKGLSISSGYSFGYAFILREKNICINYKNINPSDVDFEISSFLKAHAKTIKQFKKIKSSLSDKDKKLLFDGYIILLKDNSFVNDIIKLIKKKFLFSDAAVEKVIKKQISSIKKLDNLYIKERISDIYDIGKRLIYNIKGLNLLNFNFLNKKEKIIIFSKDLSPSQIIQFDLNNVVGFVTEFGSLTSHTSIISKSLGLIGVIKVSNIMNIIHNNDYIIIDGFKNNIYINPDKKIICKFKKKKKIFLLNKKKLNKLKNLPSITSDNYKIKLLSNIGNNKDINDVLNNGSEGIGLYRTEFLFMDRNSFPSEDEQFLCYKEIAKFMDNKVITIRTVDLGGDKFLPYMKFPKEDVPFLGWRSIRIYKDRKDILHTQLRAILRASVYGNIRVMFPMIISMEEVFFLKDEINKIKFELNKNKISFNKNIKIGAMIETPSAAIISNYLSDELDFFSIGTNDLIQYTLAVDRNSSMVSYLYEPLSPSVIHLIKYIIDSIHSKGKKISMCGELAGNENVTLLLIGLGLDELSMSSNYIPKIKSIIRNFSLSYSKKLASDILKLNTIKKIKDYLRIKSI